MNTELKLLISCWRSHLSITIKKEVATKFFWSFLIINFSLCLSLLLCVVFFPRYLNAGPFIILYDT